MLSRSIRKNKKTMAINLEKGQRVNIGLVRVGVGLGWDPSSRPGVDFDLDASAFMLGENSKTPLNEFFVFYNNLTSPDGAVSSSGDDRTGGNSDGGDDETLSVDLTRVDSRVTQIIFTATIHDAINRNQNFGQVHNAYIRVYNTDNNVDIARYDLDEDFSTETAVEFGRLYKRGGEWKFEALGNGFSGGLSFFVDKYVYGNGN